MTRSRFTLKFSLEKRQKESCLQKGESLSSVYACTLKGKEIFETFERYVIKKKKEKVAGKYKGRVKECGRKF